MEAGVLGREGKGGMSLQSLQKGYIFKNHVTVYDAREGSALPCPFRSLIPCTGLPRGAPPKANIQPAFSTTCALLIRSNRQPIPACSHSHRIFQISAYGEALPELLSCKGMLDSCSSRRNCRDCRAFPRHQLTQLSDMQLKPL
jgi:hypothetical protein